MPANDEAGANRIAAGTYTNEAYLVCIPHHNYICIAVVSSHSFRRMLQRRRKLTSMPRTMYFILIPRPATYIGAQTGGAPSQLKQTTSCAINNPPLPNWPSTIGLQPSTTRCLARLTPTTSSKPPTLLKKPNAEKRRPRTRLAIQFAYRAKFWPL